jgi:hypothetical protein
MKRFYAPKILRSWCALLGGLALFSAWQLNDIYQNAVDNLPTLVDKQGNTASVDVAMQALDTYQHLQKFHTFSIISLVLSVLLIGSYAFSTSQRGKQKTAL